MAEEKETEDFYNSIKNEQKKTVRVSQKLKEIKNYQKTFYIEFFLKNGKNEAQAEKAFRKRFGLNHMASRKLIRDWQNDLKCYGHKLLWKTKLQKKEERI